MPWGGRGLDMRQDQDARRDWSYSKGGDEPLWTPPTMPRGQRFAGSGRVVGVALTLVIGALLIIGGGTFIFMNSNDDANGLNEEELNRLMASRTSLAGSSDSATTENSSTSRSTPASHSASSTLSVFSDPPNATVLIDYDSIGVTPLREHALLPGVYILSVTDGPNVRLDTVIVVKDTGPQRSIAIDLRPEEGAELSSDMRIAQSEEQVAPSNEASQPPAEESERLPVADTRSQQEARTPVQPPREAPPERQRTVTRETNFGAMSISSAPSGAEVRVDGETVGVTPLRLDRVRVGERTVTLHLENHRTASSTVDIRPRQPMSVHETLTPEAGEVTIRVKPWGTIFIDGELHRRDLDVEYVTRLSAGTHRITVFHPAFQEREQVVDVKPNGSHWITIDLTAEARATSNRQ